MSVFETLNVIYVTEPYPSFVFSAFVDGVHVKLDFTSVTAAVVANRLGFDAAVYGYAITVASTQPVPHVPMIAPMCTVCTDFRPPPCTVRATLQPGTSALSLQVQTLDAITAAATGADSVLTLTGLNFNTNYLRVGDEVQVLIDDVYYGGIITQVTPANPILTGSLHIHLYETVTFASGTVTLYPVPYVPLVTYFQRGPILDSALTGCGLPLCQSVAPSNAWGNTVDPDTFGFQPWTYISCNGLLVSPGTLEICQDTYILLVLSLGTGNTGDVYYPSQAGDTLNAMTVFAKVLRSSTFLRADFDRVFDHVFPGAGATLTSIGIALYNPNGTPYQTHGHSVSITLKCEAKASTVEWGHGHTVIPGEFPAIEPFSRGSVYMK